MYPVASSNRYSKRLDKIESGLWEYDTRARVNWRPNPGPQQLAFESPAFELFYGGAAGGGKTDLLLGLSFLKHRRSIIFRREYTQLEAIIERGKEILRGTGAMYVDNKHVFRGVPGGRLCQLGAMQLERDREKYQGRPHDLKAYDEIPHFTEGQYTYSSGWARTTKVGQRVRVVVTGNPPTNADGEWVIVRWRPWLDDQYDYPARAGELRWFAMIDGKDTEVENDERFEWKGQTVIPRSRTFIPARLTDNPFLMATDYEGVVQGLPEPLRSQLLFGDFHVRPTTDPYQVIPTEWVRAAQERWRRQGGRQTRLTSVAVDVARGGKDNTVITLRYDNYIERQVVHPGRETPDGLECARQVLAAVGLNPEALNGGVIWNMHVPMYIDVIGVGASVYDILRGNGLNAVDINFAAGANETDKSGKIRFANMRAQAYWKAREALDPDYGAGLCIPDNRELMVDLIAPRWELTVRGLKIESKDQIAQRIGRSPDWGDSFVMSLLNEAEKRQLLLERARTGGTENYG